MRDTTKLGGPAIIGNGAAWRLLASASSLFTAWPPPFLKVALFLGIGVGLPAAFASAASTAVIAPGVLVQAEGRAPVKGGRVDTAYQQAPIPRKSATFRNGGGQAVKRDEALANSLTQLRLPIIAGPPSLVVSRIHLLHSW